MFALLILLGALVVAGGAALHRYLANLLRQLPFSNEDFGIDLPERVRGSSFPSWILEDPCAPMGSHSDHAGRFHPFTRTTT